MIGKTILHYKILSKLGEGGMGVVYKALDTKLDREVALKFLPTTSLTTEEEKTRFEQEAKAAAKLSHANIATVHAIDEVDGQTFIAMEYVDGETLSDMVAKRPLKIKDAIKIAKQVAEGLHSAHEQGIVHRDIKSANVMITAKGVVKIMDFGLAKLSKGSMVTKAGTTLGTISYMSPEQTQGEKVDHRSDIWSLGVVLYEMVSGQMPFKGDYESAIIYSIMNEEPEPLTAVRTGVPMELERIVNKLLAKEPGERYQNIIELPVDLKNVNVREAQTSKIGSSAISSSISREKKLSVEVKYSYKTLLKALALILPSVALGWLLRPGAPLPEPRPANKMIIPIPEGTTRNPWWNAMAISPDGMNFVFLASRDGAQTILMKRAGSFENTELVAGRGYADPFFSADGRWIGYFDHRAGEMYKVSIDGGEPLMITSFSADRSGATPAPNNTIVYSDEGMLKRVPESGGEPVTLTKAKRADELHQFPHMLPDGKTVLFTVQQPKAGLSSSRLAVYSFGDDDYRTILDEEGYNAVYSSSGHILYGRSNRLMAVPFDLKSLRISGVPASVLDNVNTHTMSGGMSYALSQEGTIIYQPGSGGDQDLRSVVQVDLSGRASPFFDLKRRFSLARYSPDGRYVAFRIDGSNYGNIWTYDIEGKAIQQLTHFDKGGAERFAWSPDSRTLAYATLAEDSSNSIFVRRIDGSGAARKIFTSPSDEPMEIHDWSRQGDLLSFIQSVDGNSYDLFVYSFADSSAESFLSSPAFEAEPVFSPNGKWIAYVSNVLGGSGGGQEIYVRPYPESSTGYWKVSDGGGSQPAWSPDGRKIYYRNRGQMYSVDVTATDSFSNGEPKAIFEGNLFLRRGRRWDIHPDGDRFLMIPNPEIAADGDEDIYDPEF